MADQFQAAAPSCTSTSTTWWRTPTTTTTTGFDIGSRSDESPASISSSSITFQDMQSSSHVSAPMLLDMDLGLSSDWNQPFFSSSSGTAHEHQNSFQALLQEDVISRPNLELNQIQNIGCFTSNNLINSGLPSIDYESILQNSQVRLAQFMKASPSPPKQQLQFSNETPFWNPSTSSSISTATNQAHSVILQNQTSTFSNNHFKTNIPGLGAPSSMVKRSGNDEPALKKPNLETPSPLPTFKMQVRKEKLGDRITALQQMVSPFGKTDTASVLHETIEYIKFLHDQVQVLSAPYLKNSHQNQQIKSSQKQTENFEAQNDQDLRSQGLCLVPISSTLPVANEIPTDFWNTTFIGNFR